MKYEELSKTEIRDLLRQRLKELGKRFNPSISEVELFGFVSENIKTIDNEIKSLKCQKIGGNHC